MVPNWISLSDSVSLIEAEEILKKHDSYIVALARKQVPLNVVRLEMLQDEIDELAQRVRFKFWLVLQKRLIKNPRAYIRSIVHSEVVDMVRKYQLTFPLPLDEDGDLYQGNIMILLSEGMQDPAYEFEREEAMLDYLKDIVRTILKLPPCQRHAVICSLKENFNEVLPIIDALISHSVNIDEVNWPEENGELHSLRTSLSIARKKLRSLREKWT